MLFSQIVWGSIDSIYKSTLGHSFIRELAEGTLPLDKFSYYIGQDMLYLTEYSKVLSLAAVKADSESDKLIFLNTAIIATNVETELHRYYIDTYNFTMPKTMTPSCFAYSHYLLSIASHSSFGVTVAALYPCTVIYAEIGLKLSKEMKEAGNKYARWINAYADPAIMELSLNIRDAADRYASHASEVEVAKMKEAFIMSARLEYHFWDDAYHLKNWGV